MMGDVILKMGYGALSCRIRRLSERLDRDIRDVYQAHGIYFDPCWYPVFAALREAGPLTLPELSERTGVGAAPLAQIRSRLLAEGLIELTQDPRDQRRQRLSLTAKARALEAQLTPIWDAIAGASQGLCAETAPQFLADLEVIETALQRRKLSARVKALLGRT
jgi:DNA-binding MarR family transcriptional regulator